MSALQFPHTFVAAASFQLPTEAANGYSSPGLSQGSGGVGGREAGPQTRASPAIQWSAAQIRSLNIEPVLKRGQLVCVLKGGFTVADRLKVRGQCAPSGQGFLIVPDTRTYSEHSGMQDNA